MMPDVGRRTSDVLALKQKQPSSHLGTKTVQSISAVPPSFLQACRHLVEDGLLCAAIFAPRLTGGGDGGLSELTVISLLLTACSYALATVFC
jgi:hypothetical protein